MAGAIPAMRAVSMAPPRAGVERDAARPIQGEKKAGRSQRMFA